ncbi:quinol:cytochrome C oxidoreductase [Flavobacteriaceae bacterium S356]|uniref:Quinol:cytochrome C oxidoreductase n=1 Tax=Asprobacillus argus TaxID=3076534 RepID=A0ABU3LBE1_9FLAO|nr:quinol:cytochrome C oxidoreductase [Flavobacteriaceae bacterium S356]
MYQFSGKLKIFSIALILVGALGIAYSFLNVPSTPEEAMEIVASQAGHGDGHGDSHEDTSHADKKDNHKKEGTEEHHSDDKKEEHKMDGDHAKKDAHATTDAHGEGHDDAHAEHVLHQMQNKPWSAFYVALLFFLGISLLVLAFYASQRVAQSGWSIVLFRVMEAITANLVPTSIIMIIVLVLTGMHYNHLFAWMGEGVVDPNSANFDPIVYGKKLWLNTPRWLIMSIVYLLGWNAYRWFIRKNSIAEDTATTIKIYKKNYNVSVIFLVFFMVTESMASWDWIMGLDPHWFSTLFGWYVLATLLVSAITIIAMVTIYLRFKGYLPKVNDSHIHDLAKFMFGFSVFWTYLWFAQFMLIWYSNIPEEGTYFLMRFNEYKLPFLSLVAMNFVFPILLLVNSDFKSKPWFVIIGGIVILAGHYLDLFVMIMPGTVGEYWSFGLGEISAVLFFVGILIYATFNSFAKADPVAKGNPFLKESEHFHYYNIEHEGEENHH